MFTGIPTDVFLFLQYINRTDDCQSSKDVIGFTIFPRNAEGKIDYGNKEGRIEIKGRPMHQRWGWTEENGTQWSGFRKRYNETYEKYSSSKEESTRRELESQIEEVIEYDRQHQLVEKVASGLFTNQSQMELFNIRQDVLEIKTSLRTFTLHYEKTIPFNEFEEELIEKYTALHEHATAIKKKAQKYVKRLKKLPQLLEPLWIQYPVMKEKADKASNRIFLPPAGFKGMAMEGQFTLPSTEVLQKAQSDFAEYSNNFHQQILDVVVKLDEAELMYEWANSFHDEIYSECLDPVYKEAFVLLDKKFEEGLTNSLDVLKLDDEEQEFLGVWGEVMDEVEAVHDARNAFVDKYNILMSVYKNFVNYNNGTEDEEEVENEMEVDDDDIESEIDRLVRMQLKPEEEQSGMPAEDDELRMETINRYQNDLELGTTTYFDAQDWHIILDYFERRFDQKQVNKALLRAFEQHPDEHTLLIRKANILCKEHQYQQALDLIKKAETQEPPYHPNLFMIKAAIYLGLQSPELAIPIFRKMVARKQKELSIWRKKSYRQLIDIYHAKKDFTECLTLSLELLKEDPDEESTIEKVAFYYNATGNTAEAETLLRRFIKYHPKSVLCYERLGLIYFEKKEFQKAVDTFHKGFLVDREENYNLLFHEGNAYMELKEYDEAAVCFERCLLYYAIGVEFHVGAAKAYEQLNMQPQVIEHYRKALASDPDCKEAIDFLLELNKKKMSSKE
jgi:tetratricopeptide (TPR) repeat protein